MHSELQSLTSPEKVYAVNLRLLTCTTVIIVCCSSLLSSPALMERGQSDRLVDVGGYRLHINCAGTGSPTVILDDGLGGDSESWTKVMPEVAKFTRVCTYDRPLEGKSDPSPRRLRRIGSHTYIELRNGDDIVRDLHTLLSKAEEPRPYVLVGQSIAGLYAILYARKYPQSVAGMVLVDSAHPDQVNRKAAIIGPERAMRSHDGIMQNEEGVDIDAIYAEVRLQQWHTNIPLYVLARGESGHAPPDWSPEQWKKYSEEQLQMQQDLAKHSSNGKLLIAEKSGHEIHQDQPELVVSAIRNVVQSTQVRTHGRT